jgi:hypothetical protein
VRDIKESDDTASVCPDVLITVPVFVVSIIFAFVVRLLKSLLVERVPDAFVEDLFGVLWSLRAFCSRNGVVEAEFIQKRWEVMWVIFDIELLVEKMLNLLWLLPNSVKQREYHGIPRNALVCEQPPVFNH